MYMYITILFTLIIHSQKIRHVLQNNETSELLESQIMIGKYGSTSYIGMTRKKMAANRKGIGPTTLKHACNSTTNTRTKYLLVVMHKHSAAFG